MTPLGRTPEDAYTDGFLAGCDTGAKYMAAVDEELKWLRVRNELLSSIIAVERQRAERAEAQAITLAEENAELLMNLREKIAEGMRLLS